MEGIYCYPSRCLLGFQILKYDVSGSDDPGGSTPLIFLRGVPQRILNPDPI